MVGSWLFREWFRDRGLNSSRAVGGFASNRAGFGGFWFAYISMSVGGGA
jgi:hypothetical protein